MLFRTILFILLCQGISQLLSAQSFQKILRKSDNSSHYSRKLIRMADNGYAYLTSTEFYRINQQGTILKQVGIGAPGVYDLQDIIQLNNGQFVIVGGLYTGPQSAIKLTRTDADGRILKEMEFTTSGSFDGLQLIPSVNDHFFLVFVHIDQQRRHPEIMYLDHNFVISWEQHSGSEVYNGLHAIPDSNGGMEFMHLNPGDYTVQHFKFDTNGNLSRQAIQYTGPQDALTLIRRINKTPDGGYLYSGTQRSGNNHGDIFLLKTDGNGDTEWSKKHSFYLGDEIESIAITDNGYMVLARVGNIPGVLDQVNADIALFKLNLAGEAVWIKTYGSPSFDYSRSLLVDDDGSMIIAGQATTYYMQLAEPVLFKTDAAGNFPDYGFPHPLLTTAAIVRVNADPSSPIQRSTNAALLPDGGMIVAESIIDPNTDQFRPFLTRADAQGNLIWHQAPDDAGIECVMMKPMTDGSFLSVTQVRNPLFLNDYFVTKFDAEGNSAWSKKIYANYIKDAVRTPDGGHLLCGMEHEGTGTEVRMLCVIKLNQQGDEVWKYKHRVNNKWIYGRSIQVTPENEILVAGFQQDKQSITSATCLLKLDLQGRFKWYKTFPHGAYIMAAGNKVIITTNNDYLVTGFVRYAGELGKQDLLLLKTNSSGNLIWEKEYHIDKMDAGISLLEYEGQYYIAGTTGQPEFGAKESFGLLLRTNVNGIQQGFTAFGNKSATITCTDLWSDAQHKLHFMGTEQQPFGIERPFRIVLEPGMVLSTQEPAMDKTVQIFPVPAVNTAFVSIDNNFIGPIRITITGIDGKKMFSQTFQKKLQQLRLPLPVATYPAGAYVVEIKMDRTRITGKLLIGK